MTDPAPNTCAVLFEGAGGSTEGLRDAGYTTIGYEFWATAVETAIANGHVSRLHDLSDASLDHLIQPAEVLWASSPCQPFSAAGDGEGEFDDRDGFPWALRILARMLPKVAFFENVKGLTFQKHSAYFAGILASIRALGYEVEWKVLNCADYGVPQTRERTIIIARRDGGPIVWPMPTHTEQPGIFTEQWVSVVDVLPYLPDVLNIDYWRGDGMRERHGQPPASSVKRPSPTVHGRSESNWFLRAGGEQGQTSTTRPITRPSPTVAGNDACNWSWVLDDGNAVRVSLFELATIQGFPKDYAWCGGKTAQAKQIGNAVPPRLAQVVAEVNRPR